MRMHNKQTGLRERVIYIQYRRKDPLFAYTIDFSGSISRWVFEKTGNCIEHRFTAKIAASSIIDLPWPDPAKNKEQITYWMEQDAAFKADAGKQYIPKNMTRIQNPHKRKNEWGDWVFNPFHLEELKSSDM